MQLSVLANRTTYLCLDSLLKSKIIADWSVENMNPEITQNGVLLDVSVFPEKKHATNMVLYLLFKFTVPNNAIISKTRTLISHA